MPQDVETCIGGTVCAGYAALLARVAELEARSLRLQKKLDDIEGIAMSLPADPLCTPIMLIVRQ